MNNIPTLYTTRSSYYSMIARLVLFEKNIVFNKREMDIHNKLEQFSVDYAKLNPFLTVPTLVDHDKIYTSSYEILFYENKNQDFLTLQPANEIALLRMNRLLNLHYEIPIDEFTFGKMLKNNFVLAKIINKALEKELSLCESNAKKLPHLKKVYLDKEELIKKRLIAFNKGNLIKTFEFSRESIKNFLNVLEENLTTYAWAADENYSLADIVSTCLLARLEFSSQSCLYKNKKNIVAYYKKAKSRPSYNKADIWNKMHITKMLSIFLHNVPLLLVKFKC